jgi:hypothetical protein
MATFAAGWLLGAGTGRGTQHARKDVTADLVQPIA